MWQNHMDYADDACMNLFTLQQVAKMEAAVENAPDRNTLLSSNGCQPVVATPNDAGITTILTPTNGSVSCATSLIPLVTLRNFGTSPLTLVTINLVLNGTPQPAQSWTGSLLPGTTTNISLEGINLNAGNNTLSISTSLPNGAADGDTMNDGASSVTMVATSANLPLSQGFEDPAFPPAGWFRLNPNNDFTWQRVTPGKTGAYSLFINNYDVDGTNNIDDFRSVPLSTTGVSTLFINFDVAHKFYGSTGVYWDTLSVLVSNDCGATYQTVYKKYGPALATAGSTSAAYTSPTTAEWRQESIPVSGAILSGSDLTVVFRNTSRFGNNIFIDNINIQKQSQRDLKLVSINIPAATACSKQITPRLTVVNTGAETITSFRAGYNLDNGTVIDQLFSQTLNPGDSAIISLPQSLTSSGNRMITAFTADPVSANGIGDIQRNNDTVSKAFTVVDLQNPTVKEGFELSFPPSGWSVLNPNGDVTWVRTKPGNNSMYAAFIDNFTHIAPNQTDDIKTPYLNVTGADSLIMSFDLAHKNYPDAANSDTLTILVSADCGNTYTEVYKKSGAALATAGPSSANYTSPASADWRKERISVSNALLMNGSVNVLVRNTNRFGNNIFIDNMNIDPLYHRDARMVMISDPASVLCNGSITPAVTIRNTGMENITGLKISYRIDNGPLQTNSLTGLNLPRDASVSISLPPANVSGTGAHSISIFSWEPVSVSGSGDQFTYNDTLTKTFSLAGTINAPMAETFNDISFAPANWSVVNPDAGITWNQFSTGNGNVGSAYINTFNYPVMGQKDDLASPNINFSGVDSVTLSFDLAAANYSNSGSGGSALDTLEVLVSKDCGNSFTSVYKKWGANLQTITDPNYNPTNEFFPAGLQSWRKETIDLTGFGGQGPLMLFFRTTSNWENNLFIDNVNLSTRVLPDRIKRDGYLILPSPFRNSFGVWHVETPVSLKYIRVYNAMGQLVLTKTYSGNALKMEMVDMNGKAAGVYVVQLGYSDESRNVSERVVKY
jgi:hypothetical protein